MTLEKLIKECGDRFLMLSQYGVRHSKKGMWIAGSVDPETGWQWLKRGEGKTAKEAVENLLKELNSNVSA